MAEDSAAERVRDVGARLNVVLLRAITATVVLVLFVGLGFFVYVGQVDAGALLLYAGVLLGYLLHATKQVV